MQPPGRESRYSESPEFTVDEIADVIQAAVEPSLRYAIYGHSLGGLVGFAVARELYRRGVRMPERIFVGACRPPDQARDQALNLLALPDSELLDVLAGMGGMPPEIHEEPGLLAMALRVVRSDLGWMAGHRHALSPVLPTPIVVFAGESDDFAPVGVMSGWAAATSTGLTLRVLPGGHFFLQRQLPALVRHIVEEWAIEDSGQVAASNGHQQQ